jgi:hypothetical protein
LQLLLQQLDLQQHAQPGKQTHKNKENKSNHDKKIKCNGHMKIKYKHIYENKYKPHVWQLLQQLLVLQQHAQPDDDRKRDIQLSKLTLEIKKLKQHSSKIL